MKKITLFFLIIFTIGVQNLYGSEDFNQWLKSFKSDAIKKGISKETVQSVMTSAKFLPKVIEYDRYQPEFYEDTYTYIGKRANKEKVRKGISLYKKEKVIINKIENEFHVEKELLLALMGIETNFGKYLGKMDIIS